MPLYAVARRVVRGLLATFIAVATVAVWGDFVSPIVSTWLLLVSFASLTILFLLDPTGFRGKRRRGMGILLFPRIALSLLSAGIALHQAVSPWLAAFVIVASVGALLAETVIFKLIRKPGIWAANVPGQPQIPHRPRAFVAMPLLSILVPLMVISDSALWLTATALWLVYVAFVSATLIKAHLATRRAEKGIYEAVRKYDAEQIIFTTQIQGATHQVAMWIPYLERTGKRLLIMTTSDVSARALAEVTDVPVVVRRTVSSFEQMVGPSLGAIFYVNANSGNNLMVRYPEYQHIHLGHGDSDKPSSYNPTHGMYSRIFSAGQAAVDRYAAHGVVIPREKFEIVGRPQVEEVNVVDLKQRPPVRTVFYAPTWRGHVEETMFHSLHRGEAIVTELLERGLKVIFRPHPFSYNFAEDAETIRRIQQLLENDSARTGTQHVWGQQAETDFSITDCINASDAMISDVSSVVSDFLYSGKPFAMMAISTPVADFVAEYPIARGAYIVGDDLTELPTALDEITGKDSKALARLEVRSYYLGDFAPEGYSQNFVDAARYEIQRGQEKNAKLAAVTGAAADSLSEEDEASEASENTAQEAQPAASVWRYRLRLLQRLTGFRQLRDRQRFTVFALVALVVSLFVPASATLIVISFMTLVAIGIYWSQVIGKGRRVRSQIGEPALFFLIMLAAVAANSQTETGWGHLFFAAAIALNFETRALQGLRGVVAKNLPGLRVQIGQIPAISALAATWMWVLLIIGVVLLALPANETVSLIWQFGTTAGLAISAVAFAMALTQALQTRRDSQELETLVTEVNPDFAVYFASNSGAKYQYGMWEPYLQRIDRPYVVIVRDRRSARIISQLTDVPVIYRPTLRSLDEVIPPNLRTVFYVNNGVKNTHMVERPGLINIWLNHGDSEKPACYNPVHAIYDQIFVGGQAGIDRYARHGVHIPTEKFVITGRPQVEQIARAAATNGSKQVRTVLYAPTWVGPYKDTNVYSLPVAHDLITRLLEREVRIVFRAHPHNYRFSAGRSYIKSVQELLRQDAERSGREHIWGSAAEQEMSVEDCFNISDAMICDVSAVVSDYLQSEKPFAIMAMSASVETIYADIPAAQAGYVIPASLDGLDAKLDDLLMHDPLRAKRAELRTYYLSDFAGADYAAAFIDAARTVIDREVEPAV